MTIAPFKVKRYDRPKIVYKKKRPPSVEVGVVAEYSPITHIVEVYHKRPSKFDIEHEVAHYQLLDRRKVAEMSLRDEIEEEIKADIIASTRAPLPKDYLPILRGHASSAMGKLQDWEVARHIKAKKVFGFIERAIKKYWKWLPTQWKKPFQTFVQQSNEVSRKKGIFQPAPSRTKGQIRLLHNKSPRITPKTPRLRR